MDERSPQKVPIRSLTGSSSNTISYNQLPCAMYNKRPSKPYRPTRELVCRSFGLRQMVILTPHHDAFWFAQKDAERKGRATRTAGPAPRKIARFNKPGWRDGGQKIAFGKTFRSNFAAQPA